MKVIFLDIDGVLNYERCPDVIHGGLYFVNEQRILRLKQILSATGAQVVLSSTWRLDRNRPNSDCAILEAKLAEYGICIMSYTPDLGTNRGLEILSWLQSWHGEKVTHFCILDDDNDMKPLGKYLVQTSFKTGLQDRNVKKAIKMLTGEVCIYE